MQRVEGGDVGGDVQTHTLGTHSGFLTFLDSDSFCTDRATD